MAPGSLPCVRAYLLKQLSGRLPPAVFAWQLRHEQGHFDLTQLHVLRLRERLTGLAAEATSATEAERALWAAAEQVYQGASALHARAQRR